MNPFISNSSISQLYVAASVSMVIYYNSVRRRHHLTRSGILQPARSPWRHLYDNGDESSFLNLTGFSRAAFEEMHQYLYDDIQEQSGPGILAFLDFVSTGSPSRAFTMGRELTELVDMTC